MSDLFHYIPNLLEQLPQIPADSILSQTLHNDDQVRVILFAFAEGEELTEHTSTHAAILHFIQGEADITLGDKTQTAQPGTWVQMTPNLPHSIKAKTPLVMLLLMLK
ncbi:cupin domain-containing protein [Anaerolineales bacterium HSG24]|nr:cupin domain-containing protein [Anaerolineales bacterium HSG24]